MTGTAVLLLQAGQQAEQEGGWHRPGGGRGIAAAVIHGVPGHEAAAAPTKVCRSSACAVPALGLLCCCALGTTLVL